MLDDGLYVRKPQRKMEYRKLISFGKSSYVISLPKNWVRQNKLNKGDLIYIDEIGENLQLRVSEKQEGKEKEITLTVDGKTTRRIAREIIAAYIKDHKTITLIGDSIKERALEIQKIIQNLMALEVMEQTSKKIVARDFLDMTSISIFNLIKKIDVILRAMIEDALTMFESDVHENIAHRDKDVDRLTYLAFRVIEFGLANSTFMYKKHKLNNHDLLQLWRFCQNLEMIGDEVRRVTRYAARTKVNADKQKEFVDYLRQARTEYLAVMKSFYSGNAELAHGVLDKKELLVTQAAKLSENTQLDENALLCIERFKALIINVHLLGRVVQYRYMDKDEE